MVSVVGAGAISPRWLRALAAAHFLLLLRWNGRLMAGLMVLFWEE